MILNETYELNNGINIPKMGLGTWMIENDEVADAIRESVKIGYRLIDTARDYMNEVGVGEGIRTCGIPRSELFVTTKISAFAKTYEDAKNNIEESLKNLNIGYIDMVIIHSPMPWTDFKNEEHYFKENIEVWKALEEYYEKGLIKAIGLSNFNVVDIENILKNCKVKPAVNQVLAHISNTPFELINYCKQNNILVEAYSPIGHGVIIYNEDIKKLAMKYKMSVPQICIRYCIELGLLPIPKTSNEEYMKQNSEIDFVISEEDMEILKNITPIKNYDDYSEFPVYGGKMDKYGHTTPRNYEEIRDK